MKIYNTDINETIDLTYAPTGCDCLRDLSADDTNIKYNADEERYEADSETIAWWADWIKAAEGADAVVEALGAEINADDVEAARIAACDGQEMGDHAKCIKRAMSELATEHGLVLKTYDDGSIGFVAA
jgi:hypothetical protein